MGKFIDLTGQTFGKWTVLERDQTRKDRVHFLCKCSCGNPEIRSVLSKHLKAGNSKSCGNCYQYEMIGKCFGKIVVLEKDYEYKEKHNIHSSNTYFKAQCDCGTIFTVNGNNLVKGTTTSCGCLQKEQLAKRTAVDLTDQIFGTLKALYPTEERRNNHIVWKLQCIQCGREYEISTAHLKNGICPLCICSGGKISKGELEILNILEKNNIDFEKEKTFNDLINPETNKKLRYDFYLPEYNRLIEFDGELHFSFKNTSWNTEENFKKIQKTDLIKNKYAKEHNFVLVRNPYQERGQVTLEMLLEDKYII